MTQKPENLKPNVYIRYIRDPMTMCADLQSLLDKTHAMLSSSEKQTMYASTHVPVYRYGFGHKYAYYLPVSQDDAIMMTDNKCDTALPRYAVRDVEKLVTGGKTIDAYVSLFESLVMIRHAAMRLQSKDVEKCVALHTYVDNLDV